MSKYICILIVCIYASDVWYTYASVRTFVCELYIYSYTIIACHISYIYLVIIESPRPFNLCILTIINKKQGHNSDRS